MGVNFTIPHVMRREEGNAREEGGRTGQYKDIVLLSRYETT